MAQTIGPTLLSAIVYDLTGPGCAGSLVGLTSSQGWSPAPFTRLMSDKIRVSLFDNRGAENPNAPILNGRLEIPVSQIQELMDYLLAQEAKTYEDREFVTLPVSLWQYENQPSKLKFTGSASLYRPEAVQEVQDEFMGEQVTDSPLTEIVKEAAAAS